MFEYLLLLKPSPQVNLYVNNLKNTVAERYGCQDALKSYPHITIAKFIIHPNRSNQLAKIIAVAYKSFYSEPLVVNGFKNFNDKTLVLIVANNAGINNGIASLKYLTKGILTKPGEKILSKQLHITIIKNVTSKIFSEIWPTYRDVTYNAVFSVNELLLFYRKIDAKTYLPIENYKLFDIYKIAEQHNNIQLSFL